MKKIKDTWKEFSIYLLILLIGSLVLNIIYVLENDSLSEPNDIPAPSLSISQDQILVYEEYTIINQSGLHWFTVQPTKSMTPFVDEGAYLLAEDVVNVTVGDVVTYKTYLNETIIHRVIKESEDENGTYYTLKGDNNARQDSEKVRLEDMIFKVVGVIY
jgi:signal peptidase I